VAFAFNATLRRQSAQGTNMPTFTPTYAIDTAQTGYGDVVAISVDGGNTFIQVMQTKNMQYSNQKKDFVETTSTTSTGGYKTYKGTLKDPGSFTFDIIFKADEPSHLALAAAYDADTILQVKHVYKAQPGFTSGPINTFSAEVESFTLPGSDEAKVAVISVSLKISGPITQTAAVAEEG
jgi:predicted secreted protein